MAKGKKAQYDNIKSFLEGLDKERTLGNKLNYILKALLGHGGAAGKDFSLSQLMELGRQYIAQELGKQKASNEKGKEADHDEMAAKMFLGNPTEYVKGEAKKTIDEIKKDPEAYENSEEVKKNCENIIPQMNKDLSDKLDFYDKHPSYFGVKAKMEANVGGRKNLDELYKATQPSRFSRIFSTYSAKWSALEEAYDTFNNPNKNGFGQMDHLEEHANAYLKHKFPKWNPGEEIPAKAYSKLNKTELAKVNFSVNVLNAIKEQREVEKGFDSIVKESKEADIKFENIPEAKEDADQLAFQVKLMEDTNLENDESLISSSEDSKEFNLLNDNSIEEEKLDEPAMSNKN